MTESSYAGYRTTMPSHAARWDDDADRPIFLMAGPSQAMPLITVGRDLYVSAYKNVSHEE